MRNLYKLLLFSDYILPFGNKCVLVCSIVYRFCIIAVKANRNLQPVVFHYSSRYLFENSYLVIQYKFNNAIWYKISSVGITLDDLVILNLNRIKTQQITITIFGFFQSETYVLEIEPQNQFITSNFKIDVTANHVRKFTPSFLLKYTRIQLISKKIFIRNEAAQLFSSKCYNLNNPTKIIHSKFDKTEFI